jgi:hypothetical protein
MDLRHNARDNEYTARMHPHEDIKATTDQRISGWSLPQHPGIKDLQAEQSPPVPQERLAT